MRKSLTTAMAALTFGGAIAATAAPAEARDRGNYYRHDRHGNNTGAAVAAGVVGLALGAALASSGNRRSSGYYNNGYYSNDGYYGGGYAYNDPYYGDSYYGRGRYYSEDRYAYRTCESSRWVWDPYIRERVLVRSTYRC
jgi:hypothetical protein